MKKIKANRFTKKRPEEIAFSGGAFLENPNKDRSRSLDSSKKKQKTSERTNQRSTVRSNEQKKSRADFRYRIEIPRHRRKVRHSFDIFEDQKWALEKLQLAIADQDGKKPSLGDMVQDALDQYCKHKGSKLKNTEFITEN